MKIERLYINNYKSLVDFELAEPNSFSVFVGPNAAGKSNVFEALEFLKYFIEDGFAVEDIFGGASKFFNKSNLSNFSDNGNGLRPNININLGLELIELNLTLNVFKNKKSSKLGSGHWDSGGIWNDDASGLITDEEQKDSKRIDRFSKRFSRIFVNNSSLTKVKYNSPNRLALDAYNLEKVLRRILQDETIQEEFVEWLQLLIPEFEDIKIHSDNISGIDTLLIKEKYTDQYFDKSLISDGTYNILALLTAVYQSEESQFLCIEEPENGLNPYVIRELAGFFRQMCEEKGHLIWLNTHSQSLVDGLNPEELILIEKKEGITKAKQFKGFNTHGLKMGEAWLSNALGGGVPW